MSIKTEIRCNYSPDPLTKWRFIFVITVGRTIIKSHQAYKSYDAADKALKRVLLAFKEAA